MSTPPAHRRPRRRVPTRGSGGVPRRGQHALLAARFTDRDRWILRMLAEHRVLTTHQLQALAFGGGVRYAQQRLRELAALGVIGGFRRYTPAGSVPYHWVLEQPGRVVLAAEDELPAPRRDARQVGQGLALAHNQQLEHQLGVNTCLTHLATQPRDPAGGRGWLRVWWGQARCTRHFPEARPDAFAIWTQPEPATPSAPARSWAGDGRVSLALFLEYDTGSETLHQLATKLGGYHELALRSPERAPLLLFWLPTPRREHHARHALTEALDRLAYPGLLPVATAHPQPHRADAGWHPRHPTWQPLSPPAELYGQPGQDHQPLVRVSLATLTTHHGAGHSGAAHHAEPPARLNTELAAPSPQPPPVTRR